jgi:hypothetical protein
MCEPSSFDHPLKWFHFIVFLNLGLNLNLTGAEKMIFSGCSKMSRCKAAEILRSEAYLEVRRNKPAPCSTRGRMRETQQMGFFQEPAKDI